MSTHETPRKVLITGASSAIGVETCRRYLAAGHSVVGQYFKNGAALAGAFPSEPRLNLVHCDLTDFRAASELAQSNTDCDVVVFLAALAAPSRLENLDWSLLERTLAVGALSNYILMSKIGPAMAERQWGRLVIGSSIGVKFGGGLDSFAYALANHTSEFLPRFIRGWTSSNVLTNVVRIGVTDTPLHKSFPERDFQRRVELIPLRRAATAVEIAEFIHWYGSERNSFIAGQIVAISGGE